MRFNKYGAKRTVVNGITFASRREAERYSILRLMEKNGLIIGLELQPKFELQPAFVKNGKKNRPIFYIGDFFYVKADGTNVVEDSKGFRTPTFRLKQKMFDFKYPDLLLLLV